MWACICMCVRACLCVCVRTGFKLISYYIRVWINIVDWHGYNSRTYSVLLWDMFVWWACAILWLTVSSTSKPIEWCLSVWVYVFVIHTRYTHTPQQMEWHIEIYSGIFGGKSAREEIETFVLASASAMFGLISIHLFSMHIRSVWANFFGLFFSLNPQFTIIYTPIHSQVLANTCRILANSYSFSNWIKIEIWFHHFDMCMCV